MLGDTAKGMKGSLTPVPVGLKLGLAGCMKAFKCFCIYRLKCHWQKIPLLTDRVLFALFDV